MVVPDVAGKNSESRFLVRVAATVLAAIIFGALYLGREVFVPIALAVLLSFVLAPLVRQLGQNADDRRVVHRLAGIDFLLLDGRQHEPQGGHAVLLAGLERGLDVGRQAVLER